MSGTAAARLRARVAETAALVPGPALAVDRLELRGDAGFSSCFDVDTAALTAAALTNLAAGYEIVDRDRVAALLACHVELDGQSRPKWADLSGHYRTRDGGYLQFHCNFPHHAEGVLRRLGCEADRESVQAAVLTRDPAGLEAELIADGMIAARMRTIRQWDAHPHAEATGALPVISVERVGDGPPRDAGRRLRVLDCSRVLAGPVAGMTLAAHGADVLRVGAARLPSVETCVIATGFGKRNTDIDVATADGAAAFGTLLDGADVWIDAYRPGAFDTLGFPSGRLAPGAVAVKLNAFDLVGPWAGRRGFDSIVQTTTGIVAEGMRQSGRTEPTPLPVQALDYCTGLLAAFAAQQLVRHQAEVGGTWLARLSLLRTRNWLVGLAPAHPFEPAPGTAPRTALQTVPTDWGTLTAALPLGGAWATPPRPLGTSEAAWEDR